MSMTHCDVHGLPWKIVPAGVSKTTGNPYGAFTACPERGCKQKPPLERPASFGPRVVSEEKPDWDAIAKGKVRHGVVCSMIQNGRTKEEIVANHEFYVDLIMGNHPEIPF